VLAARAAAAEQRAADTRPLELVREDLRILGAVARRARTRLKKGAADGAEGDERAEIVRAAADALAEVESLKRCCDKELGHAG
jgi:hypothetical protein